MTVKVLIYGRRPEKNEMKKLTVSTVENTGYKNKLAKSMKQCRTIIDHLLLKTPVYCIIK